MDSPRTPTLPLAIGLQDGDGLFIPVIREGTPLPASGEVMLSTRSDYQSCIEFYLYQGLRPLCKGNLFLASFLLDNLEMAPRGVPRIRLSLRVESDGAVHCRAENLGTMTDMELLVRASYALQRDDVQRLAAERGAAREQDAADIEHISRRRKATAGEVADSEAAAGDAAAGEVAVSEAVAREGDTALHDALSRRFRVIETRSGGMGIVFICENVNRRRFAVKMLKPSMRWKQALLDRFVEEAQLWIRVGGHGNIVRAYQVETINGYPCLVLEYVDGGTLRQRRGPMPAETAIDCAIQCARGLRFALQQHGIVHRDVKPGNVLLGSEGRAKISDFGLAALLERQPGPASAGQRTHAPILGTPAYMAPEQFINPAVADFRADLYSLGALTYELLAGRLPFYGNTLKDMLQQRLSGPPIRPSNINPRLSPALDTLLLDCLAERADSRPSDYAEVIGALSDGYTAVTGHAYERPEIIEDATPWSLLTQGMSRHALGDYQGALQCFDEALRLNPQYFPSSKARAETLRALQHGRQHPSAAPVDASTQESLILL